MLWVWDFLGALHKVLLFDAWVEFSQFQSLPPFFYKINTLIKKKGVS